MKKSLQWLLVTILVFVSIIPLVSLAALYQLDPSFGPGEFNASIYAFAMDDNGKILVGGDFTTYDGDSVSHIARLNPDGSLDETFVTGDGFDGSVNLIAFDENNKIVVSGFFFHFDGDSVMYITRLQQDVISPSIDSFVPEDESIDVDLVNDTGEFAIVFDENIFIGTGNITLYRANDDSIVEAFDVTDGDAVEASGENVTLYSAITLDYDTEYYFLIDEGAFEDESHNPFEGISDSTTWNFTTRSAPAPIAFDFERVSVNDEGAESDDSSNDPAVSSDGRYVAFHSGATNLVPDDTNPDDIFVYDRDTDTIKRVSVNDEGDEAGDNSSNPTISSNGRHVAFLSQASNLVPDDTNGISDIFVYDRDTDTIERIGDDTEYSDDPVISGDGRYVSFVRSTDNGQGNTEGLYRYDRIEDTLLFITQGALIEGDELSLSSSPSVSEDGLTIAFISDATSLVSNDTNDVSDVFVYKEVAEQEPTDHNDASEDDDESGGSGHHRRRGGGASLNVSSDTDLSLLEKLQLQLIELLKELLAALLKTS